MERARAPKHQEVEGAAGAHGNFGWPRGWQSINAGRMSYDYDKLYGETAHALGEPTAVFEDFFDRFETQGARVLDVGCGQGRDALFIARRGHRVVGVDLSPNGIRDLRKAADEEGLAVQGIVADLTSYRPDGDFDVVLIDRTLHMLPRAARLAVLKVLLDHVAEGGWLLIADERSNIPDFRDVISAHPRDWRSDLSKGGHHFVQMIGQ